MGDALIEAIARAIFAAQWEAGPMSDHGPPDFGRGGFKTEVVSWQAAAQAALTAITEAGMVIVPREPTEAMIDAGNIGLSDNGVDSVAGDDAPTCYRAMLSAAPPIDTKEGE